jgi:hypothetical protein
MGREMSHEEFIRRINEALNNPKPKSEPEVVARETEVVIRNN